MASLLEQKIGKLYTPKTPYIDGFDAACWLGRYWDRHKESMDPIRCPDKYKQGTKKWTDWHDGYADGLDEIDDFRDAILFPDPPEFQFVQPDTSATEVGDNDQDGDELLDGPD